MVSFSSAKEQIKAALGPYKRNLEPERQDSGFVSDLLYLFEGQRRHHIDLLIQEAASELRKYPEVDEAAVEEVIAKYVQKAKNLVRELK